MRLRESQALHRRRRPRQPRPGGIRLRAGGRGRHRPRCPRRDDRRRHEQRRGVSSPDRAASKKRSELGIDELEVVSDSELLVKQMQGEYRVKNRRYAGSATGARAPGAGSAACATRRLSRAQRARGQARQRRLQTLRSPSCTSPRADVARIGPSVCLPCRGREFKVIIRSKTRKSGFL